MVSKAAERLRHLKNNKDINGGAGSGEIVSIEKIGK